MGQKILYTPYEVNELVSKEPVVLIDIRDTEPFKKRKYKSFAQKRIFLLTTILSFIALKGPGLQTPTSL